MKNRLLGKNICVNPVSEKTRSCLFNKLIKSQTACDFSTFLFNSKNDTLIGMGG